MIITTQVLQQWRPAFHRWLSLPGLALFGVFVGISLTTANTFAASTNNMNKAIIISAENCSVASEDYSSQIAAGANRVAEVFLKNTGYQCQVFDDFDTDSLKSLEAALVEKPQRGGKFGTLVVYWTSYVLPHDPRQNPDITFALSDYTSRQTQNVLTLRELCQKIASSPAETKLLVLDTFLPDQTEQGVRLDLNSLKNYGNIYVIATSDKGLGGRFWEAQKMSYLAYWFAEAMRGSADRSLDGNVSLNELCHYLSNCITSLSQVRGTPQKILAMQMKGIGAPIELETSKFSGGPTIISTPPENEITAINRVAEQLKAVIPEFRTNRIAVREFTRIEGKQLRSARDSFAADPVLFAKELENRLISKLTTDRCVLYPKEKLEDRWDKANMKPEDIMTGNCKTFLENILVEGKPLSAMIVGYFKNPNSHSFTCGLIDAGTMKPLFVTNCVIESREVFHLENYPEYPIQIQVKTKQRDGSEKYENRPIQRIREKYYVQLRKGEVYQVVLWNFSPLEVGSPEVGFRVLVDGMNSHPEKDSPIIPGQALREDVSSQKSFKGDFVAGKLIPPRNANFWVLRPTPLLPNGSWPQGAQIKGFYSELGENSTYREFTVSDAKDSIAARSEKSNTIGQITVGVYELEPKKRGNIDRGVVGAEPDLGTRAGDEKKSGNIKVVPGKDVGKSKFVIDIYYLTPESLQKLKDHESLNPSMNEKF